MARFHLDNFLITNCLEEIKSICTLNIKSLSGIIFCQNGEKVAYCSRYMRKHQQTPELPYKAIKPFIKMSTKSGYNRLLLITNYEYIPLSKINKILNDQQQLIIINPNNDLNSNIDTLKTYLAQPDLLLRESDDDIEIDSDLENKYDTSSDSEIEITSDNSNDSSNEYSDESSDENNYHSEFDENVTNCRLI